MHIIVFLLLFAISLQKALQSVANYGERFYIGQINYPEMIRSIDIKAPAVSNKHLFFP